MPNTTSAKKALRQSKARRIRNLTMMRRVKRTVKEYGQLIEAGQLDEAAAKLPLVQKSLDKAAKAGTIKQNTSSRLKSRLSRKLKTASEPSGAESQAD